MGRTTIIGPISSMRRLKTALRQSVGDIERASVAPAMRLTGITRATYAFSEETMHRLARGHSRCRSDPK
jgi:hypothetical protein